MHPHLLSLRFHSRKLFDIFGKETGELFDQGKKVWRTGEFKTRLLLTANNYLAIQSPIIKDNA